MIAHIPHLGPFMFEVLPAFLAACVFFVLGVAFAIYRAVDWVERMRAWAYGLDLTETDPDTIAGALVDTKGHN